MKITEIISEKILKALSPHFCIISFIDGNIIVLTRGDNGPSFSVEAMEKIEGILDASVCMFENEGRIITLRFNEELE